MKTLIFVALLVALAGQARAQCEASVEGSVSASGKSPGGVGEFGTDYWMTDDELKQGLKVMAKFGKKDKDVDAAVAKAMKDDPRIYTFLFNCQAGDVHVSFMPANGSRYKDNPFGPKKYKVQKKARPGEIHTLITVKQAAYLNGEGELDLTRFDETGVAGTFQLTAHRLGKPDEKVTLKGKFSYPCHLPSQICRDAQKK
jgi:hypothetical protein